MTRADVVVLGLGLAGRATFQRLADAGVDVAGFDPAVGWVRPGGAGDPPLWSPPALGLRLPCHLELPSRFLGAMGARGVELVASVAEHHAAGATGADWVEPGAAAELAACRALGVRAEAVHGGFRLLDATVEVDELVRWRAAAPTAGEVTIHASGRTGEPWLADKVMPVRWQWIAVRPGPPRISRAGTVYSVGGSMCGARWASPHMEVGETAPVPSPAVTAALRRLAEQDGVALPGDASSSATAGIVTESCDGLPVVGPVPGRPRDIALTGFGVGGRTYLQLAVRFVVESLLGDDAPRLPACLGTARFR